MRARLAAGSSRGARDHQRHLRREEDGVEVVRADGERREAEQVVVHVDDWPDDDDAEQLQRGAEGGDEDHDGQHGGRHVVEAARHRDGAHGGGVGTHVVLARKLGARARRHECFKFGVVRR